MTGAHGFGEQRAVHEIGTRGLVRLRHLRDRLYGAESPLRPLRFRTAPSIIVRSEAELFALAYPRFAYRSYLREDLRAFVNARRLRAFVHEASEWGEPQAGGQLWSIEESLTPGGFIEGCHASRVADAVLPTPQRFLDAKFHVITTELGLAYGEHQAIQATPFINHINLGGGMCAQANAFMANVLAQAHAENIYGIAEITALAAPPGGASVELGGMRPDDLVRYFRQPEVGLYANRQYTFPMGESLLLTSGLARAMESYLLSNIPLIALVDLARMAGRGIAERASIYARNKIGIPALIDKTYPHAILVLGIHKGNTELILHDPATYPFLVSSLGELVEARMATATGRIAQADQAIFEFVSVTPRMVRLPLLREASQRTGGFLFGLFEIAALFQHLGVDPTLPVFEGAKGVVGDFRLVNVATLVAADGPAGKLKFGTMTADDAEAIYEQLPGICPQATWCWLQYRRHSGNPQVRASFWIWDATREAAPPGMNEESLKRTYLHAVLTESERGWTVRYAGQNEPMMNEPPANGSAVRPTLPSLTSGRHPPKLKASLITSFMPGRLSKVRRHWPQDLDLGCELYAFMQGELAWARRKFGCSGRGTVTQALAQLDERPDAVERCANDISALFPADQIPIVALASFFPEISASPGSVRAAQAQAALRFLCRIAMALRDRGHPAVAVEAVAGACMNGVWRGGRAQTGSRLLPSFQANILRGTEPCRRLLTGLRAALEPLSDQLRQYRLVVAMELEPGPLYLLRDWTSLDVFCEHVRQDPILYNIVGLNLDIAHWIMAPGVTPEKVRNTPHVMSRIVHAHCSGHHGKGHFGDICLFDLNGPEAFIPYIDLLQDIADERTEADLPFSRYVSIEFEAAPSPDLVRTSVEQLRTLF